MFLSFVFEHGVKKVEMCTDGWKDRGLVLFLIYTFVFTTRLASKDEEKTLRVIFLSQCHSVTYT